MSLLTKILAALNLIAAGVLFYFAGRAFYVRYEWSKVMDRLAAQRDGIPTSALLDKLEKTQPEVYAKYQQLVGDLHSEASQRRAAGLARLDPVGKSVAPDGESIAKDLGPEDFMALLHELNKDQEPVLAIQERDLLAAKARLTEQKQALERKIAELQASVARYQEAIQTEQAQQAKLVAETNERKRELGQLNSELEEAMAARNQARARENDMKTELKRIQEQYQEIANQLDSLLKQIRVREEQISQSRG
jgi:chromosome segregation ATPase